MPRTYTPGTASVDDLLAFQQRLGFTRAVLVQPSSYGTDNAYLVDALERLGPARARGIAVVDLDRIDAAEAKRLHRAGVRGLRLNLEVKGGLSPTATAEQLRAANVLCRDLGWCIQVYADAHLIEAVADTITALDAPVVLDHFGGVGAAAGADQPAVGTLVRLLKTGRVHGKLSAPYRLSKQAPDHADVQPIARAVIDAAPRQLVWASDWPHTGSAANRTGDLTRIEPFREIDDARMLALLDGWAPDPAVRRQIVVDNRARLYDFAP